MSSPTLVRLVCLCGHLVEHNCFSARWNMSNVPQCGTTWRSNATAASHRVLEVANDWVVYADTSVAFTEARALRRTDFLTRFTYLDAALDPQDPATT